MALVKTFRSTTQINGVAEGVEAISVDWDDPQEHIDAIHAKLNEKEAPILALQIAIAAARAALPPATP